ncbi:MAG: hypothetical protein P8016_13480 [Sedimentisphaerales bacterium]
MIAPDLNRLCEQAKIYYYDFLFQEDKSEIPEEVQNHLRQCEYCQKRIYELKTAITQAEIKNQHDRADSGTPLSNMLKLHFSYIDQDVTCAIAKSFMPGMLDASMQISVPTPITAHLDHCRECSRDLEKLRELNFSEVHLFRLGRLFAAKPDDDDITCARAESDMMAFVMMAFHESDEETLNHLCACSECRNAIYQYRQAIREELVHEKSEKSCSLTSKLSYDDVFNYTIPYGLDLERYSKSEFQGPTTSHIRRCPFCLEKMQALHRTIYGIAERPDSQIVTKYNVKKSTETAYTHESKNLYTGFPVSVDVSRASEGATVLSTGSVINFAAALKRKVLTSNFRPLSRTGVAAILIIAVLLTSMLFYPLKAKALTLEQLYSVFGRIDNVRISTFEEGMSEPAQERWISRADKIQIYEREGVSILSDVIHKLQVTKRPGVKAERGTLSAELLADTEQNLNSGLDLVYNVSSIPAGSQWKVDSEAQTANDGTEVYELIWTPELYIEPQLNKLVFFIDSDTNLPFRVEFRRKLASEDEYKLQSYRIIKYPDDKEIAEKKMLFE